MKLEGFFVILSGGFCEIQNNRRQKLQKKTKIEKHVIIFLSPIWLLKVQLWAIIESTESLIQI